MKQCAQFYIFLYNFTRERRFVLNIPGTTSAGASARVLGVGAGGRSSRRGGRGPGCHPRKHLGNICSKSCFSVQKVLHFTCKGGHWFCAESYKFGGGNFWSTYIVDLQMYKERQGKGTNIDYTLYNILSLEHQQHFNNLTVAAWQCIRALVTASHNSL